MYSQFRCIHDILGLLLCQGDSSLVFLKPFYARDMLWFECPCRTISRLFFTLKYSWFHSLHACCTSNPPAIVNNAGWSGSRVALGNCQEGGEGLAAHSLAAHLNSCPPVPSSRPTAHHLRPTNAHQARQPTSNLGLYPEHAPRTKPSDSTLLQMTFSGMRDSSIKELKIWRPLARDRDPETCGHVF